MQMEDSELQGLVSNVQSRFARFFGIVLCGKKVSFPQYNLLTALLHEGEMPMNQLAKRLHITNPAITHLVDRLEKESYLTRQPHPKDRRVLLIKLTSRGATAVRGIQKNFIEFITRTFSRISPSEREIIKKFYRILLEEFERISIPT